MTSVANMDTGSRSSDLVKVHGAQGVALDTASLTEHSFTNRELTYSEVRTIQFHLSNSRSKNTNLAYKAQWTAFVAWCGTNSFVPFPANIDVVVLYMSHLGEQGWKRSKIEQALSAVKAVHADNADLLPPGNADIAGRIFQHPRIRSAMASIRRMQVEQGLNTVAKPRSFSQHEILAMVEACPQNTPRGLMERAVLLLGVNAGLRASEIVDLRLSDVAIDDLGMDITIRKSKSDQFGDGAKVFVGRLAPSLKDFDAVTAMSAWLSAREQLPARETEDLFLAFRKGGHVLHTVAGQPHAVTRLTVTAIVQRCARQAGIQSEQSISSHSLRHSFITNAFGRGLPANMIAKTSRHKSMSVLSGYDQTSHREQSIAPRLWQ